MSAYWRRVVGRLFRLSRAAVNAAIPQVLEASLNSAYDLIEEKLRQIYKRTIRNAAITLAINVAGLLILIFHPFGKQIASWISMAFFAGAFVFWLVRVILYCKNYGRVTVAIAGKVIKKRSLSKSVSSFITDEYPLVTWTYAGIDLAASQFSALKEIPRARPYCEPMPAWSEVLPGQGRPDQVHVHRRCSNIVSLLLAYSSSGTEG